MTQEGKAISSQERATGEETARWHDFGAWLAQKRVDLGYTQAHVASQADISTQSLVSLEHGGFRRYADGPWILPNPRDDTLVSLARLYGVKAEEMFKHVGRYNDRPQTKTSLRRRGRASSRHEATGSPSWRPGSRKTSAGPGSAPRSWRSASA
jgi:DNA-binding XRE family transcriptional regulator